MTTKLAERLASGRVGWATTCGITWCDDRRGPCRFYLRRQREKGTFILLPAWKPKERGCG